MGADLFESYVGSIIATITLAYLLVGRQLIAGKGDIITDATP